MDIQVGPATITIHSDDEVLVCEADAKMSSTQEQGFFARDTRFVSGYRLKLGRIAPLLLNSSVVEPFSARFEFTNPKLLTATNASLASQSMHLRLDRSLGQGLHEDYQLTNYSGQPVDIDLEVSLECDFADIFDVKAHTLVRRGALQSSWDPKRGRLITSYVNGTFTRAFELQVSKEQSHTEFANGGLMWRVHLDPGQTWHTCLLWGLDLGEGSFRRPGKLCHALRGHDTQGRRAQRQWVANAARFEASDPEITATASQAIADLSSLRIHMHDEAASAWNAHGDTPLKTKPGVDWVPAAGVPWFVSLFGRDSLIVSLQTLALSPRFALGALRALSALQADAYDDNRDMQPGKIEHEVRHGELATLKLIPHTPYYGTHDATTLLVWLAAEAWRWHGDRAELDAVRPHVERALSWIDKDGDIDGDGLQEYKTRAAKGGYYNQGWKDSGEAIVHEDGTLAPLPIALCELQGYVVAAKRAWGNVLREVYHETSAAKKLEEDAKHLAEAIEKRFWWEEEGTYYLGLDGNKQPIRSVASNPAHLLWARAIEPERARSVTRRLMAKDMWSGWGIRTLSSSHVSFNPFSYQLGSVWPHDNAIAVAGFRYYGLDTEAAQVTKAIFDAAGRFLSRRLPELFAGLERDEGSFPVQYLGANVPQAWASGAVVHMLTSLLGISADASSQSVVLQPALPDWLPQLSVYNLQVGKGSVDLTVVRDQQGRHTLEATRRTGNLEVRLETAPASVL
jgi:glycogen debranching enzyme